MTTPDVGRRWLAIVVGTLVWAVAFWFGLLVGTSSRTAAFAIIAVGLVFAMYALTALGGEADVADTAFRGALGALIAGSLLVVTTLVSGSDRFMLAAVVIAPGVGAAMCLPPSEDRPRVGVRLIAVGVMALIGIALHATEPTAFGLIAPLFVLPGLGIADIYYERVRSSADVEQ